ncbi:MAG: DUF6364 family protein [Chloroflexota bacterium]
MQTTKTKLTIRTEKHWIERAKAYAQRHDTTVTQLVTDFFRHLDLSETHPSSTPILDRLTGILPTEVSVDEHHEYLDEKYGL